MSNPRARIKRVILACVNPEDFFIDTLDYHLRQQGYSVEIGTTFASCASALVAGSVYAFILELPFSGHDALMEHLKLSEKRSNIPVVQLVSNMRDWASRVRLAGDVQLVQPFSVQDVSGALKALAQTRAPNRHTFKFSVPPETRCLDDASERMTKLLAQTVLSDSAQIEMMTAFREAIGNASQHSVPSDVSATIAVEWDQSPAQIELRITDNGEGFPWSQLLQISIDAIETRRRRAAEGRQGGLGIMLMRKCVDELRYNDKGNQVTLIKRLPQTRSSSSSQQRALTQPA